MRRQAFRAVRCRHVHVYAQTATRHFQMQAFAIHKRNRSAAVGYAGAHLSNLRRERTGRLVCTEQEVLLHGLAKHTRILVSSHVKIANALFRCKFKRPCSRTIRPRCGGDAPERKRLHKLYKRFFAIVTREPIQDFRPVQKANADTVLGTRGRRFNLAVLQAEA